MLKLDLQGDSLRRAHGQHSQVLQQTYFQFLSSQKYMKTSPLESRPGADLGLGQLGDEEHVADLPHAGEHEALQLDVVLVYELLDDGLGEVV